VPTYTIEVPEWLTVTQACSYLKVSRRTLYRWCDEGKLPYYELEGGGRRRFDQEDLDNLLKLSTSTQRGRNRYPRLPRN
jgi:excisionase family DNA binding protein